MIELTSVQASIDTTQLATFYPTAPRALILQPVGHRLFDHLVISVLLLMREKDDMVSAIPNPESVPLHPFC